MIKSKIQRFYNMVLNFNMLVLDSKVRRKSQDGHSVLSICSDKKAKWRM